MKTIDTLEKEYEELNCEFLSYKWGTEILYEIREKMKYEDFDIETFVEEKEDEFWNRTKPICQKMTKKLKEIGDAIIAKEMQNENEKSFSDKS